MVRIFYLSFFFNVDFWKGAYDLTATLQLFLGFGKHSIDKFQMVVNHPLRSAFRCVLKSTIKIKHSPYPYHYASS